MPGTQPPAGNAERACTADRGIVGAGLRRAGRPVRMDGGPLRLRGAQVARRRGGRHQRRPDPPVGLRPALRALGGGLARPPREAGGRAGGRHSPRRRAAGPRPARAAQRVAGKQRRGLSPDGHRRRPGSRPIGRVAAGRSDSPPPRCRRHQGMLRARADRPAAIAPRPGRRPGVGLGTRDRRGPARLDLAADRCLRDLRGRGPPGGRVRSPPASMPWRPISASGSARRNPSGPTRCGSSSIPPARRDRAAAPRATPWARSSRTTPAPCSARSSSRWR